mmetsp:Transcript_20801/g.32590  ORF Transcript_20801/g.32590 Transcript_20801/m.32590 type:complete len:347 (-) Transcript_20801:1326-2366(-)
MQSKALVPGMDFNCMPEKIEESLDRNFLWLSGIYPPTIKCFDVQNFSLKLERRISSQIIDFKILSQDWKKLVILKKDNNIEFHTKNGCHYQLKIPGNCVNLNYNRFSSSIHVPVNPLGVIKINLEKGKSYNPQFKLAESKIVCSDLISSQNAISLGFLDGVVKIFDLRTKNGLIGKLKKLDSCENTDYSISFLNHDLSNPMLLHIGYNNGKILSIDMRNFHLLSKKSISKNDPVAKICTFPKSSNILAASGEFLVAWDRDSNKNISVLKGRKNIIEICKLKNTGMILLCDGNKFVKFKYFNELGPLPNWIPGNGKYFSKEIIKSQKENLNYNLQNKKKNLYKKLKI